MSLSCIIHMQSLKWRSFQIYKETLIHNNLINSHTLPFYAFSNCESLGWIISPVLKKQLMDQIQLVMHFVWPTQCSIFFKKIIFHNLKIDC